MVGHGPTDDELSIDWGSLLKNLPDDLSTDFCDQPIADGFSYSPDSGCSLSIEDIQQYLLNDEFNYKEETEQIGIEDGFLSDLLLDSLPESDSDRSKDYFKSTESVDVDVGVEEEEIKEDKPQASSADVPETKEKNNAIDADAVGDDETNGGDHIAKKRKRQMRNRDAAMRSRERKKMYVKELEMKSKFYEAECKRLGILLQSCVSENQALRFSIHNSKAFDASMTKQESAVLLLESLLLGSLLGFLGIVYLLILLPRLQEAVLPPKMETKEWGSSGAPRKARSEILKNPFHLLMLLGKRCKASRSRMKKTCLSATNWN